MSTRMGRRAPASTFLVRLFGRGPVDEGRRLHQRHIPFLLRKEWSPAVSRANPGRDAGALAARRTPASAPNRLIHGDGR